ncbi:MAG: hypothetical protein ACD_73C00199G0003 [uncultured bacterium]|nr:MAG: hypothetical protein ACD_73C00199G0003 [uncultured bacterium]
MVSEEINYKVKIIAYDKTSFGKVRVKQFSTSERGKRALKTLAICWAAAIFSVFLPIAHFVLVPGFLIAGIALPFHIYGAKSIVLGGRRKLSKMRSSFRHSEKLRYLAFERYLRRMLPFGED